ncbi:MAG: DUF1295 domain-containing protein [Spirosomataceae bacterium]
MTILRIVLLLIIVAISTFLLTTHAVFGQSLMWVLLFMTALWLYSLYLKDASIVDSCWGGLFAIQAWYYQFQLDALSPRNGVLAVLVTIWAVRLGVHIALRNKGEDYRYQAWRQEAGKQFWWISYLRVFVLQGLLAWIIGAPLFIAQTLTGDLQGWDYLGILLWTVGFCFETIGDWQLTKFKQNPDNQGKVLATGLWYYTRHPNYFGDALLWWGYFCFALSANGYAYAFSPILMTFLLMKVSGVALLEQKLVKTKPQYKDYIARTSAFFPRLPSQKQP